MIEQEGATRAKTVAANLDKRVASKITKIEVDEVFQGQQNVILGAIAKGWNYLIRLQWSPDRTKASIAGFLKPIAKRYSNITVVITDLFSGYKDLIKTIFQKAVHLVCHIHAERILRKPLRHLRATFTRQKKALEHMRMQHHKGLKKAEAIRRRIDFLTARQHKDRKDRQDHEKTLESKTTPRTQTLTRHIDNISDRVKKDHKELSHLRSQQKTLERMQKDAPQQIGRSHKVLKEAHQDLLQSSRLVHQFHRLLQDFSSTFEIHKQTFMDHLRASPYSMAGEIKRTIQENPALFSVRNPKVLSANFQNTNTIEGVFALFRRLLDGTRLLPSEAGSTMYCDLFRLYHNTMPPFTGSHQNQSPVERLGVKLHGKNYLDLLFPLRTRTTHYFAGRTVAFAKYPLHLHPVHRMDCEVLSSSTTGTNSSRSSLNMEKEGERKRKTEKAISLI